LFDFIFAANNDYGYFQRFFDGKHVIEETVTIRRTGNSL